MVLKEILRKDFFTERMMEALKRTAQGSDRVTIPVNVQETMALSSICLVGKVLSERLDLMSLGAFCNLNSSVF